MAAKKTQSNRKPKLENREARDRCAATAWQSCCRDRRQPRDWLRHRARSGSGRLQRRYHRPRHRRSPRAQRAFTSHFRRLPRSTKRPQIVAEVCDVRDPESVASLFATVKRRFGKLDVLVNNAGITQPTVTVENTTLELWRDVIDTNLTGMFLCTRAALPMMQAGATIVNNLSAAAKRVFPNYATYSAAKRGALGFTLSLREELIPRGIRVMALMPGATATDMWEQIMPNAPRERMVDVDSVAQAVLYAVLLPPNANLSEWCWSRAAGAVEEEAAIRYSLFANRR